MAGRWLSTPYIYCRVIYHAYGGNASQNAPAIRGPPVFATEGGSARRGGFAAGNLDLWEEQRVHRLRSGSAANKESGPIAGLRQSPSDSTNRRRKRRAAFPKGRDLRGRMLRRSTEERRFGRIRGRPDTDASGFGSEAGSPPQAGMIPFAEPGGHLTWSSDSNQVYSAE